MKSPAEFLQTGIEVLESAVANMPMSEHQTQAELILENMKRELESLEEAN